MSRRLLQTSLTFRRSPVSSSAQRRDQRSHREAEVRLKQEVSISFKTYSHRFIAAGSRACDNLSLNLRRQKEFAIGSNCPKVYNFVIWQLVIVLTFQSSWFKIDLMSSTSGT